MSKLSVTISEEEVGTGLYLLHVLCQRWVHKLLGPYKDLSGSYYRSAYSSGGHRFTWVRSVAKALFTNGKVGCKLSSSHSVSRKGLRFRLQGDEYRMGTHASTAISLLSPFSSPSVPETEAPK